MQFTATRIYVRWQLLVLVACVLSAHASTVMAQLRFAGPSNQPGIAAESEPVFRSDESIRQAQFHPADAPPPPPQSFAPQAPTAASELDSGQSIVGSPSAASLGTPSSASPSAAQGTGSMEQIPAPMYEMPEDITWAPDWNEAFDSELMQQEQAFLYSTNAWFRRGFWYAQADVVALLRTEGEDVVISADNSAAGVDAIGDLNAPILTTKSVDPTYTPGTRLTIGRFLGQDVANRDHTIEFAYFGLFDYSESATLVALSPVGLIDGLGPGNHYFTTGITGLMVGVATPGFGDAKQHDIQYDSDFNSFEANFRVLGRPLRDRLDLQPNGSWVRNASASHLLSFLAGMRVISINEMFQLKSTYQGGDSSGRYVVKTSNDMFGLHVGGEAVDYYSKWSWGGRFKAGALFNFADRRSNVNVVLNNVQQEPRSEIIDSQNLAGVLEGGLMANYQVRTNLQFRVAYDAMYITGLATATENMGLSEAFPPFEVTGDAIFHGLSVGVEMFW